MCDVENLMIQQQQQVKRRKKKTKNWHSPTDASGTRWDAERGGWVGRDSRLDMLPSDDIKLECNVMLVHVESSHALRRSANLFRLVCLLSRPPPSDDSTLKGFSSPKRWWPTAASGLRIWSAKSWLNNSSTSLLPELLSNENCLNTERAAAWWFTDDVTVIVFGVATGGGATGSGETAGNEVEEEPKNCKISRCFFSALSGDREASYCFVPTDALRRSRPGEFSGGINEFVVDVLVVVEFNTKLLGLSRCCLASETILVDETLFINKLVGERSDVTLAGFKLAAE